MASIIKENTTMDYDEIKLLAKLLNKEIEETKSADLAPKWEGGNIEFQPKDQELVSHSIEIDKFMHKIVMVRDNLRVLEQQINSNKNLSDGEKLKFQNYITKCYGSLTSFNFMFKDENDKFSSK